MKNIFINSSTIKTISYNIHTRELQVQFKRGAIYNYKCVDYIDVLGIIFSDSSGYYFNKNVANNYKYEKVED